jgi:hypothetical protein
MPKTQWRKLRVVVEVPARGEGFTEKDLRWIVEQLVGGSRVREMINPRQRIGLSLGKTGVKEFGKVLTALGWDQMPAPDRERLRDAAARLARDLDAFGRIS